MQKSDSFRPEFVNLFGTAKTDTTVTTTNTTTVDVTSNNDKNVSVADIVRCDYSCKCSN